jgi:hypothetical protein
MSTDTWQFLFSFHRKKQEYKLATAEWKRYSYKNLQISFLKLDIVIEFHDTLDDD